MRALADGLRAVPVGLHVLFANRGVKRLLIPPVILTTTLFGLTLAFLMRWVWRFVEAVQASDIREMGLEEGWLHDGLRWLIERTVVIWFAKLGGTLLVVLMSSLLILWTFSLAYEAIAGPFLDEIQGRLEKAWFGIDPRNAKERPTDLPVQTCVWLSSIAGALALVAVIIVFLTPFLPAWTALAFALIPFIGVSLWNREYGVWLAWVVRLESKTLWVSVKASTIAGLIFVAFLWLKLIPVVGFLLFALLAGFTTAISLLDIPFSRRGWPLLMRLRFLARHFGPISAYGAVAGLFFLVPVIGPVLMVPSASIGGLWLLMRIDKTGLDR